MDLMPMCKDGVPMDFALFTILAGFMGSFGILYRSLTLTTGARKRRENRYFLFGIVADVLWSGKLFNYSENK